ncbi:MAG: recombinase family protein [Desulfobaccales bacterium]
MKKAVGYVRVSTEEQAREGVSLENQGAKIKAYCELNDFVLIEIVADEGLSAKNLNRPGIKKILDMARNKEIEALVVYKLDRAFRSTIDALEVTKELDNYGIGFHSINERLDTKSPLGKFFFTLIAGIAEMERGMIGERTSDALQRKIEKGEHVGHIPFGYKVEGTQLTPFLPEQEVIRLAKELRDRGYTLQAIAEEFKSRGVKTKRGLVKWYPTSIRNILMASL